MLQCVAVCCSVLQCVTKQSTTTRHTRPVTNLKSSVTHQKSVLQCVAVWCSVLQCVAVCCSVLQCVVVYCNVLQCVAVCCSVLQSVAECCSVLQCAAVCCSVLRCVAVCCSVLQCVAVCCSVLQVNAQAKVLAQSPPTLVCYKNDIWGIESEVWAAHLPAT